MRASPPTPLRAPLDACGCWVVFAGSFRESLDGGRMELPSAWFGPRIPFAGPKRTEPAGID